MSTTKIRLWQIGETDKAYQFSNAPANREGRNLWVPRSIIEHISREPGVRNQHQLCVVTLPDWFIEKEGL